MYVRFLFNFGILMNKNNKVVKYLERMLEFTEKQDT